MASSSVTPPVSPKKQPKQNILDSEVLMELEDSPLFLDDLDEIGENAMQQAEPVCFQCNGEVLPYKGTKLYSRFSFHDKGIIKSGALDRMFAANRILPDPDPVVDLFDFTFVYTDLTDRMDRLFMFARQAITRVQNQNTAANDNITTTNQQHRQNLVRFLQYANDYILSFRDDTEEERTRHKFLQGAAREFHLLLVHAGRISDGFTLSSYSLNRLSGIHHSLHQHLELYWYLLQAFHTLTTVASTAELSVEERMCQSTPGEDDMRSPLAQLISIIITDLVSLAVPLFNRLSPHEWLRTSPFACGCMVEFWVLLQHLVARMKETLDTESFWVRLHEVLQRLWDENSNTPLVEDDVLDTDVFVLDISPRPSNPLGFSLWFVTHLSHLFIFNTNGNECQPEPTQSCAHILQMIMEKMLHSSPKEESLRASLRCCLSICSVWSPSTQLVTLLWEYFFRKLNDRFQLHTTSIDGLAVISKNSTSVLERCKKWCSSDDSGLDQDTSFHLFLRLLARLLTQGGAVSEWRSIKGRFYSKFHQRRMQELTETGLHNLTCLFLTLGLCVDAEEVATKLSTFYDMLDPTSITSRLRAQVWLGGLAMTQLLAKQRKNFSLLAEKLAASFDSMSRQLPELYLDYSQRQEISSLMTLYIEGVRDVFEMSDLEGCEHILIGEGITTFLKNCGENDLRNTLSSLDSIVMRIRCVVAKWKENQLLIKDSHLAAHKAVAERLWCYVFPFVIEHAQTLTPPLCLADLAVSFTHLAMDFTPPYTVCSGGVGGVFKQFTADAVSSSIICHYLSQVLSESTLRETVVGVPQPTTAVMQPLSGPQPASVKVQQCEIVRSWWHCVMIMPPGSKSLSELTQQVMQLPEVKSLLLSCGAGDFNELGTVQWKVFVKCIGTAYSKAEGLLARQQIRTQVVPYFSGITQQMAPIVRTMSPLESVLTIYRAVGYLVKHCAPLLYVQSKPCPLPDIVKSLILPASVFSSDKPLNSHFLATIRETLHLFVEGLSHLDYRRDSFIQRQIRNIITQYLPRFPLRVLRGASQSSSLDVNFRKVFCELVQGQLQKSSSTISHDVAKQLASIS